MKIGILQPGYLPWLGYFEQLSQCDIFVHLDDVQYTKNDWRNRNRIKTKAGVQWLTVPVSYHFGQNITEVILNRSMVWSRKHIGTLRTWYGKSPFFNIYFQELEDILSKDWTYLVDLDLELIRWLMTKLGICVKTFRSSQLSLASHDRQVRLIEICKILECDHFYEGESGRNYIDAGLFQAHGITVEFQEYKHPYYNQQWSNEQGFISHLSVIDLLFNHGTDSLAILTRKMVTDPPEDVAVRNTNES